MIGKRKEVNQSSIKIDVVKSILSFKITVF